MYLENDFLKIMILPEIGGRLQMAYDKVNERHMVYYNHVIKPALVGVTGPWVSGGIEFNFPTHHKPTGFDPSDFAMEEHPDGSKTIWVNEIERMYRLKGMTGFTLYPDKAYIEISVRLFNRTQFPQSFLWWANPALEVDENFQAIFPPDVAAVYDHGRRDVTKFPIATGSYYKHDYSEGVDISWYKNVPVPTSYMVEESGYDFIGGYDHGAKAGFYHVANHHMAPGKKFWSWGISDFSRAWDRQLTDTDGPYLELMTGVASNNQPDLSWIAPLEEKSYHQYFMPYREVGAIKNANTDACVGLAVEDGAAVVCVYVTSPMAGLRILLTAGDKTLYADEAELSPAGAYKKTVPLPAATEEQSLRLLVRRGDGSLLIEYSPAQNQAHARLEAAKAPEPPEEVGTVEQLYLTAVHLEQYRHATCEPDPYYLEGLKRDPSDSRCNNGYGLLLLKRGCFAESEAYFRRAIKTLSERNPNPNFTEPFYNLGIALKYQCKYDEAYNMLYKSVWTAAGQDMGYFALAQIDCIRGQYAEAMEHVERALVRNTRNHKARHLKAALLRKQGLADAALALAGESLALDKFNMGMAFEQWFTLRDTGATARAADSWAMLVQQLQGNVQNYLEFAYDYMQAGLYGEVLDILGAYLTGCDTDLIEPLVLYSMGYAAAMLGDEAGAKRWCGQAAQQRPDGCFPHQLESIAVLERAMALNPRDAKAPYYLGNLYYAKKQAKKAIGLWEQSAELDDSFPTVHRNLALAYYNVQNEPERALEQMERAFSIDRSDYRIFAELDQLNKKLGKSRKARMEFLKSSPEALEYRDDMYLELITLYNETGAYEKAHHLLMNRQFHPWEANEGKVGTQWKLSLREMARAQLHKEQHKEAAALLEEASGSYPDNLGEGKLPGSCESDIHYFLGVAYDGAGDIVAADRHYLAATRGGGELQVSMFYYDQPAHNLFYEGLAKRKLGSEAMAKGCFHRLVDFGEANLERHSKIDYFAIQLADTSVFNSDMDRENRAHSHFLMGLGHLGLGNLQKATEMLNKTLELDPNHQEAGIHLMHLKDYTS